MTKEGDFLRRILLAKFLVLRLRAVAVLIAVTGARPAVVRIVVLPCISASISPPFVFWVLFVFGPIIIVAILLLLCMRAIPILLLLTILFLLLLCVLFTLLDVCLP